MVDTLGKVRNASFAVLSDPWDPWDWYICLHLVEFYGKCR